MVIRTSENSFHWTLHRMIDRWMDGWIVWLRVCTRECVRASACVWVRACVVSVSKKKKKTENNWWVDISPGHCKHDCKQSANDSYAKSQVHTHQYDAKATQKPHNLLTNPESKNRFYNAECPKTLLSHFLGQFCEEVTGYLKTPGNINICLSLSAFSGNRHSISNRTTDHSGFSAKYKKNSFNSLR